MYVLPSSLIVGIIALVCGAIAESGLTFTPRGNRRTILGGLSLALTMFGCAIIVTSSFSVGTILALLVGGYRAVNVMRAVEGRMHEAYLRAAVRRSSIYLFITHLAVLLITWQWHAHNHSRMDSAVAATGAILSAAFSCYIFGNTLIRLQRSRFGNPPRTAVAKLPTLSLLIPARNETDGLDECIEAALKIDYPKLEIIVYDDCSQDKTPELIKSYAHDGVRFIQGTPPPDNWLPKNHAYDQLAQEATGKLLFFMGVDVRLAEDSISKVVDYVLANNLEMISLLPRRTGQSLLGTIVQPMRYWLEIALPQFITNRPPVLSTAWLINKNTYKQLGGMKAVTRAIIPETFFARELAKQKKYRFVRASDGLNVLTKKSITEQIATAIRTRYPLVHRRPEYVLLLSLFEVFALLAPFALLIMAAARPPFKTHHVVIISLGISAALLVAAHVIITLRTNPKSWWVSLVSFPFVVLCELILLHISMVRYEFSSVSWKGRNVCLPVMHAFPSLPLMEPKKSAQL
jgi:glycosyltransferase involved in cell wall biosynthesis